ncbi:MAG: MEDS domain-containing protein [Peptostreptococcaceae bacterium]|nr:MEDS domain-containing protein [Peptostreptococcaceae bacterium]
MLNKNYQSLVEPGDHMVLLYEDENEVVEPLVAYIAACINRNERCIYVSGDTNMELLIETLCKEIDYFEALSKKQLMMLDKKDAYSKDGIFEPDKMILLIEELTTESIEMGYNGMAITGELSWLLEYGNGIDKIIEYEWKLNDRVFNRLEVSALCRYNLNKYSDETIINIIQLHPYIVYKNRIHENPYYLPLDGYREGEYLKYRLSTWLENINEFTNTKSKFTRELEKINSENKAKSEFLSRMSHDMRTPLGAIIGMADFGIEEVTDNVALGYFGQIKESAEYLLSLMSDVLDSQRLETGKIVIEPCVFILEDTENKVLAMIESHITKKDLKLITELESEKTDVYYKADENRLIQILINILNNSIKYTQPNGTIIWKQHIEKKDNQTLLVNTIIDNGAGMSKEFQTQMFECFTQEKNSQSRSEGGTGLGLNIVKRLVSQMEGQINCVSELYVGTEFTIELPLEKPSIEEIEKYKELNNPSIISHELKGKRILVCEDIDINAKITKKILEKSGIIVKRVYNGQEAVQILCEEEFDAVLMDVRMPVMDGLEATSIIRTFNTEIPIIAISANASSEDVKKSIDAGMNRHLSKPLIRDDLIRALEELA